MTPFFSIIIPVYNVASYLRECLDSVLAQTFTDWEAICVDDGSSDESSVILDEYAAKNLRFRVIHQINAGVSAARNAALAVAKGNWVTFVDADDRIEPWRLAFFADVIQGNPQIDWIRETHYLTHSSRQTLSRSKSRLLRRVDHADVYLYGWKMQIKNSALWLNTYKAEAVRDIRFPLGVRYAEDDVFEIRALARVTSCAEVGYGGYWYRDDRVGAASRAIRVEDSVKIHELLLRTLDEQKEIVGHLRDREAFARVFTQTVRKDFGRVLRGWYYADRLVRHRHAQVARQIRESPYFNWRYSELHGRIGYVVYLYTGCVAPMILEDWVWRLIGKCKRTLVVPIVRIFRTRASRCSYVVPILTI